MKIKTVPLGFNLIELIISLAIAGIVAVIALPGYQHYLLESRRSQGINQLMQLHLAQQNYRLNHAEYADQKAFNPPASQYYKYEVNSASATQFSLMATAIGDQRKDARCTILLIDQSMRRSPIHCWQ